jgi:ABC-type nitrate/sulfonate/bicarbonate transport system permease component
MIDEILVGLFGEAVSRRLGHSRRAQLLFRVFFGLLGAALGVAGAVLFARNEQFAAIREMQISMVVTFAALAAFSLFNVALGRKWRWPGLLFVVSFVAIFVTRIAFGP